MIKKTILSITVGSFALMVSGANAAETTGNTSTTAGSTYITPGSGGNAAGAGRSAQISQLIGAAANAGAAGMFSGVCATKYGSWACPLAAAAALAASLLGGASGGSGSAGSAMSAFDPSLYGVGAGSTNPVVDQWGNVVSSPGGTAGSNTPIAGVTGDGGKLPDGTTSQTIARDVAKIRSDLEKSGVQLSADGKTMTTKDGRKFDLTKGADGSMEGLQAMGLTAAESQQAMSAGAKYNAAAGAKYAAMIAKMGADGGGGGGAGARGPASEGGGDGSGGFKWSDPRAKVRAKAKVAGLTRKLGDDTIGVAGDDIFEMVTRRYKARDQSGDFLKD